jgi:hypothetical protein
VSWLGQQFGIEGNGHNKSGYSYCWDDKLDIIYIMLSVSISEVYIYH